MNENAKLRNKAEEEEEEAKEFDGKRDLKDGISSTLELIPYFERNDHSVNKILESEVPRVCRHEPCRVGIDEAGRGPVLGPMVYGIAYAPLSEKQLLVDLGCADSKSLTEEKRNDIFNQMCERNDKIGWAVEVISPNVISNCMYRRTKTSLNEVSMNSAIGLIEKIVKSGVNVSEVYVDTVGKPEKYQAKLEEIFPQFKIVVAKKADSTYPIVSAASICAKVSRDHALRAWQFREGCNESEYGSGYPNDPVTKKWLAQNVDQIFGFPQVVRFSWSTAEHILESEASTVEWEDPANEDEVPTNQKISKYFARVETPTNVVARKRHAFFTERYLHSTSDL